MRSVVLSPPLAAYLAENKRGFCAAEFPGWVLCNTAMAFVGKAAACAYPLRKCPGAQSLRDLLASERSEVLSAVPLPVGVGRYRAFAGGSVVTWADIDLASALTDLEVRRAAYPADAIPHRPLIGLSDGEIVAVVMPVRV